MRLRVNKRSGKPQVNMCLSWNILCMWKGNNCLILKELFVSFYGFDWTEQLCIDIVGKKHTFGWILSILILLVWKLPCLFVTVRLCFNGWAAASIFIKKKKQLWAKASLYILITSFCSRLRSRRSRHLHPLLRKFLS